MTPPIDPILLEIGPFAIHWYGILVVTGILLGARVASYLAERAGRDPEMVWDMLLIAVIGGIIGAAAMGIIGVLFAIDGFDELGGGKILRERGFLVVDHGERDSGVILEAD